MSDFQHIRQLCETMVNANPDDHFHALGLQFTLIEKGKTRVVLPYSEAIVGNPETGVIHGGALTALLDTACGFAAMTALDRLGLCPTIDLRIDYMGPAKPGLPVYAQAEAYRVTKQVIFCRGIAYQDDKDRPVAHCVANFTRLDPEVSQQMEALLQQQLTGEG